MAKIYDCSNSDERPIHKGHGGPKENEIITYLKEYAPEYGHKFISHPEDTDVIITNDVFPKEVLSLGKPMVKRMCGPFWQNKNAYRNDALNAAARAADKVIFITKYSEGQYHHCFGDNLKDWVVVPHWVDPKVFYDRKTRNTDTFAFAAIATDWAREEKRLVDLYRFANIARDNIQFHIIGKIGLEMPKNCICYGYCDSAVIVDIMNVCDGFINLSYREAMGKVMMQAISCGLPVLYADSGGANEVVGNFGQDIYDIPSLMMEDYVPQLRTSEMELAYNLYRCKFDEVKRKIDKLDRETTFKKMLDGYFQAIESVLR
jgi:glycosyltransferase involved in cell wall biosynthesis